jgi:hypothetical protein
MKTGNAMSQHSKTEYFRIMQARYQRATPQEKSSLLTELCRVCGYHRKHAIRKLSHPLPDQPRTRRRRGRGLTYDAHVLGVLRRVWEAAGYPWSVRLKALLPLWLPWISRRFQLTAVQKRQLLSISARQIDRRFRPYKTQLKKRLYGRTKPGSLLKHHIPIRTEHWDVHGPGSVEIDLVSHSGNSGGGHFIYSLNLTDIFTGWVETRAVLGKGERGIVAALDEIRRQLPFPLCAIDSDNGSEFINDHLYRYCQRLHIQFTRGRPYKKDDNAHIEQKNWTHVRKLLGWERYDSPEALAAINDLYRNEWRQMMNLFQPSVKLQRKKRVGSHLKRQYDAPQTPLDRLLDSRPGEARKVQSLLWLRTHGDPFELASQIEMKIRKIWDLANDRQSPHVKKIAG